jgi:hypothetical protein
MLMIKNDTYLPSTRSKSFLGWSRWKTYFCSYPQCRSSAYVGGVYVILILRAWQIAHKGHQAWQNSMQKQAAYMSGSFPSLNNMYGSSGNSSFVMQKLIM